MRPAARTLVLLPIALTLLFGCGGGGSDPTQPPASPVENATLSADSAPSLGRVAVEGLPLSKAAAKVDGYEVVLTTPTGASINLVLDEDGDGWFFRAPLHPDTPNDGGDFQVLIRSGENESAAQPLQVGALPEAPGAFSSLVAKMREHLEQRAVWAGTTIEELAATPAAEVAPAMIPLKLAQSYLDSESDPHDLTDLAANSDGFLSAEHRELLDRLFGYFDMESLVQAEIDDFPVDDSQKLPLGPLCRSAGSATEGTSKRVARRACINAGPDISSAPELSMAMIRSAVAQFGADPNSEAGQTLDAGATMMAGLGVVPEFGVPAAAAGAAIATVQAAAQFVAGILPSSFVSITSQVDRTEFNEDSTGFARYSHVQVKAASTGWSADQSIANVALNVLGGYLSAAEKGQILGSDGLRDIGLFGLGQGAGGVFDDTNIIEFCSQEWTVDISSPLYCTAAALQHHFDVDIEGQKATPREAGNDQLRVAAQSAKFGGREIHEDHPMRVEPIDVDVSPADIYVEELGETVSVTADIQHADLTTLRWTPQYGSWEDGTGDETNDGRTRPLKTPTDPDAYPFLVTVESLSRNGARSSGQPPRVGFATVRHESPIGITIDPTYACITPGETQQFTAEVTGVEDYTVIWEVTSGYGSINQDGLYQSVSGGTSNAVITASVAEVDSLEATAELDAAGCNCSLDISIGGGTSWQHSSSQAAYQLLNFGTLIYQFWFDIGNSGSTGISVNLAGTEEQAAPQPGDTGTWRVSFAFVDGDRSWTGVWDDEKGLTGVSVHISELTETSMVGSFTGKAYQFDDQGDVKSTVIVDAQFRASYWDGGRWPCE